jgi:hypothetical protein
MLLLGCLHLSLLGFAKISAALVTLVLSFTSSLAFNLFVSHVWNSVNILTQFVVAVVISVTKEGVKFSTRGDIGTANIVCRQNTTVDKV